jgi:hypothetical protein
MRECTYTKNEEDCFLEEVGLMRGVRPYIYIHVNWFWILCVFFNVFFGGSGTGTGSGSVGCVRVPRVVRARAKLL